MKKSFTKLFVLLLCLLVLAGCTSVPAVTPTSQELVTTTEEVGLQIVPAEEKFELCQPDGPMVLHTEAQTKYLSGKFQWVGMFASGKEELSRPLPASLSWYFDSASADSLCRYEVLISETEDFAVSQTYSTKATSLQLYNCKIGTCYFWKVRAVCDDTIFESGIGLFETENTPPRNLFISGITNVRDLGGWKAGGTVTKQGLLYRCGRLTSNSDGSAQIDRVGIAEMNRLGIRTEIDLREDVDRGGITQSALGDQVRYIPCQMTYDGNILENNTAMVKKVFSILADEANYPLIFHCSIGTDRTGMIAFLVNGLLGLSRDDCYWDYLFSNFGEIGGSRAISNISGYVGTIDACEGDTQQIRIENYLLSIGVTQEEIESIRNILLEK